jgi:DNA helicase-2/ATP-dependent DNA helicase PcrA
VGDDDQSIYAFRGADVGNILAFERHFPGAKVITLEENYRSTQRILSVANAVIAANPHRHPKRLRTANAVGAPIDRLEHEDEMAEAEAVAQDIAARKLTGRVRWRDCAVLYRTNPQAKALEEALRARGVPYRVVGGTSFFDRKEVADAIAWLRAAANPLDEIAVRRIINVPARGIGRTTIFRLAEEASARGAAFVDAVRAAAASPQATSVRGFMELLDDAAADLEAAEASAASTPPVADQRTPLAAFAADFFRRLRLEEDIDADPRNARSADARVDNLRDVAGTIERWERRVWDERSPNAIDEWHPPTLADALGRLALADRDDDAEAETGDRVTLMTLHSAKGLEFREVFLVGLEEGILPHSRSLANGADNEAATVADPVAEERRLLYVGVTRAQQRLVLSSCQSRRRNRERMTVLPSRFLEQIPEQLLQRRAPGNVLTEEESKDLRATFFSKIKDMLDE